MAPPCQKWHEGCRECYRVLGCIPLRTGAGETANPDQHPAKSQNPHPVAQNATRMGHPREFDRLWGKWQRKTKRPRLNLSLGTSVDQPSPKCCSIANVFLTPDPVNGSSVPDMARTGSIDNCMKVRDFNRWTYSIRKLTQTARRKTKARPRFPLKHEDR